MTWPRVTRYTLRAMPFISSAASNAELPAPTTAIVLSLYSGPSQVEQYTTPKPSNSSSPGISSRRLVTPLAMMTESARMRRPDSSSMTLQRPSRLRPVTYSPSRRSMGFWATCSIIRSESSGPVTYS